MDTVFSFLFEFLGQFFGSIWNGLKALVVGIGRAFDFTKYIDIIKNSGSAGLGWGVGIFFFLLILALLVLIIILVVKAIKKGLKNKSKKADQATLVEEVNALNKEVMKLNLEKDKILSMKVSQIGLNPNEISELTGEELETLNGKNGEDELDGGSRFYKLTKVDERMADHVDPEFDKTITLPEICERFRNFACSRMGLFYEIKIIRLFLSSFASTRLLILQGISGTGKTSLPYAFGKFIYNDAVIASVQPSWRDRSELFGYFNEFTKRYNETDLLEKMYEATYTEVPYVVILDEMNIARVEYYFAEMLSILEMPSRDEWIVDLVPSVWDSDPKHLTDGKLTLPTNMWYVGTANNDDSTFAITDKVYDRAMPIDINTKGTPFDAPDTEPLHLSAVYLEELLDAAKEAHKVSQENLHKIEMLDDYVIEHFRLAFGNRIVKQLRDFVPAYVGCGGTEVDGIDYVLAKKVLRKFEQLNLSFIRDEIDGLCDYLDELWGEENMGECKEYLRRLQKLV